MTDPSAGRAPADRRSGDWPGVSYVMPVLNEVAYLAAAVETVLAQSYEGERELVLAVGPSSDGTNELAARLAASDARVVVVDNPGVDIPIGLNLAIARARHDVIVRVDAHSELPADYTRLAVEILEQTGAANVGGLMLAKGSTPFQRAAARGYNARIGLGGGAYHSGREAGESESAYLGVFRREALDAVGGYDETLRRGEDWELNLRIRRSGRTVWFDPRLVVTYWPRESLRKLARQFNSTGVWRGELVRRHGGGNGVRYFVPPALVIVLAMALVMLVATAVTVALSSTYPIVLAWITAVVCLGPLAYLGLLVGVAATCPGSLVDRARFAGVIATMHVSWGLGFLRGVLVGAGANRDTSRTSVPKP